MRFALASNPLAARTGSAPGPAALQFSLPVLAAGAATAYFTVFRVSRDRPLSADLTSTVCNVVPLLILGVLLDRLVIPWLRRFPLKGQRLCHIVFAAVFSLAWYWLVQVATGISEGGPLSFRVGQFFPVSAIAWQLLQGLTVYALIAVATADRSQPAPSMADVPAEPSGPARSRYFVRRGDEIRPVDVGQIVTIAGADDYAEVTTTNDRHLISATLNDLERSLDADRFVRVHRSPS